MSALMTCERDLQTILLEAIKYYDFSVIYGHRTVDFQQELFSRGRNDSGEVINRDQVITYCDGINKKSKHNYDPSRAADCIPYPSGWKDENEFYFMAGVILSGSDRLFREGRISRKLTWGGYWKNLVDLPHFQLIY